jgi:MFS family permease
MRGVTTVRHRALRFVVLLGIVSLFADMTYEGARSAVGPFLGSLGADAFVIGLVSGGGELVGYVLRLWSGRLADATGRYWALTFFGYAVNLLAVPLLALSGRWETAAVLVILERAGRALRTPARDAMLSYATSETGRGWGFGLHEALDQTGAVVGPLIVAAATARWAGYRAAFAMLLVPALCALGTLTLAWRAYPDPRALEHPDGEPVRAGLGRAFWVYLAGSALVGLGYIDYPLMAFHFARVGSVSPVWIPVLYAIAMGADGLAALALGRWFDKAGLKVLAVATAGSAGFALLALGSRFDLAVLGTVLWGIGLAAQESVMRAAVASMTSSERRGTAYGTFNTIFGVAWFAGSAFIGWLYSRSIGGVIAFSVVTQLLAIPWFVYAGRLAFRSRGGPAS